MSASNPPSAPRHRLLLELGRGGMGTVYLAVTQGPGGFNKLKVVKQLRAELALDPAFLQMFLDEARLSARLNHPNVVQTNEVGFDGEHYFIEMEFLEGRSLETLTRAATTSLGRLPLPVALYCLAQTLAGLHYAHELTGTDGAALRVVHRDVSPHNVFVTYDGTVKVLDFGIAKAADSSMDTSTGVIKGKLAYMAPEQAARREIDRRADIFSAGVILWQALTNRRLWGNFAQAAIFMKLDTGEIEPPRKLEPEVPEALDAICMRALALRPEDRFATAAEFQLAIEEYLDATNAKVGPRQVAALMAELFGKKRIEEKVQIDARLKETTGGSIRIDLPVLGHSQPPPASPMAMTNSAAMTSSTTLSHPAPPKVQGAELEPSTPADALAPRQRRAWLAIPFALGAAALVALAYFAVRSGIRGDAPPAVSAPPAAKATPCWTSDDCIARPDHVCGKKAVCVPQKGCRTNAECVRANGGAPFVCRKDDGACVGLASEDCRVLAEREDLENDGTIWLGTMFPMTGDDAKAFGFESVNAADLARRDFAQIAHGIPSPSAGGATRPVALLACDDNADAKRAAHHLVDDVQVPAVIGFYSSQEVIDLSSSLFIPRDVLAMATQNRSSLITTIPHPPGQPRLVWRTTVSSAESAAPVALVVSEILEPQVRALPGVIGKHDPMRVALLRPGTTAGLSVSDSLFTHLRFNGKSALDNGASYQEFLFGDPDRAEDAFARAQAVTGILDYKPHVVIYVASVGIARDVLAPIEARWPKSEKHRPRYVSNGYLLGADLFAWFGTDAERKRRFLGVNPPTTTVPNAKLTMHYNESFSPKVSLTQGPGAVYDAFYVVAYATYALGGAPITGSELARGIARLVPPGTPVDVGPAKIFDAFNTLRGGKNIDLDGAATRLDFDLATGDSPTSFAVLCVGSNDAVESNVVYDARAKRLDGLPLRCP